jgi:hypothetical protein
MDVRPYQEEVLGQTSSKNTIERRKPMKKPWGYVLVIALVAATEAIVEILKHLKKKGKAPL